MPGRILKRPAFFLAVVLTLTLGIGANSAIFSVIDAVLLKPLPYPGSDRLMALYEVSSRQKVDRGEIAPVRIEEWNRLSHSFNGIAGAYTESLAEPSGALPERLVVARCSPRFFAVLATPPLAGREFSPEEDLFNGPSVAEGVSTRALRPSGRPSGSARSVMRSSASLPIRSDSPLPTLTFGQPERFLPGS
jgi:hypothetical protein